MSKLLKLAALLPVVLLAAAISGCWDYKNVDRMNYLTSMSIDHENGQFVVYLQSSQFSGIAKREGAPIESKQKDVVAIGRGESLTDAIFKVYRSEQIPIYWGHLKAMIFTKRALRSIGIVDLTDLINRYREVRYNLWVFGTEERIEKLLSALPFYNRSMYESLLMKPDESYRQFSSIQPIYLYRFLSDTYEKGKTAVLPNLALEHSEWLEGGKEVPLLTLKGAYFFKGTDYLGELSMDQLKGKRYLDKKMFRVPLAIESENKPSVIFVVRTKDFKVRYAIRDGRLRFSVDIKVKSFIDEMLENIDESEMKQMLERQIAQDVRKTYDTGKRIRSDVLNLSYPIFKYHYSDWKTYLREDEFLSSELDSVRVQANILHSGKYKARIAGL